MTSRQLESRQDQCTWAFNADSIGPCSLDPNTICQGSLETALACACSSVSYYLAAACDICNISATLSWDDYALPFNCGTNGLIHIDDLGSRPRHRVSPETQFGLLSFIISPPSAGEHAIPSWALAMGTETPSPTTFDLAAATSLASFISINSAFPSPTPTSIPLPFGGFPTSATGSQQPDSSTEGRESTTNPTATSSQKSVPSTKRLACGSNRRNRIRSVLNPLTGNIVSVARTTPTPTPTDIHIPDPHSLASQCDILPL
ncbi:hypothetical protein B0H11DRAFT_1387994 [Mycena galericulata]|nr:hypothetical protein B0H11DRAFT_1387994 [Mycena galericulata]